MHKHSDSEVRVRKRERERVRERERCSLDRSTSLFLSILQHTAFALLLHTCLSNTTLQKIMNYIMCILYILSCVHAYTYTYIHTLSSFYYLAVSYIISRIYIYISLEPSVVFISMSLYLIIMHVLVPKCKNQQYCLLCIDVSFYTQNSLRTEMHSIVGASVSVSSTSMACV